MKKVLFGVICLLSSGLLLAQSPVEKQDHIGWIIGGSIGTTNLSIKPVNRPQFESSKESETLLTVYSGYNYTDWFGIEFDFSKTAQFTDRNTNEDASIFASSFSAKFSHHLSNDFSIYLRGGLQYLAYSLDDDYYRDDTVWNSAEPMIGAGLNYSFPSGVRVRVDYKYSSLTLDRNDTCCNYSASYDDEIDASFNALTIGVNYQF